jgi:hypothetical protein
MTFLADIEFGFWVLIAIVWGVVKLVKLFSDENGGSTKVTPSWKSRQRGDRVKLTYINASGAHRTAYVDSASATRTGNIVKVNLWNSSGKMELVFDIIKNPEAIGMGTTPAPEPLPPVLEEEDEPPILEPKALELGEASGRKLIYTQRGGKLAVIFFDPATVEHVGNLVNLSPMGIDERYAIALGKIVNPEALEEESKPEIEVAELPPVLLSPEPIPPETIEPQLPIGTRVLIRRVPTDSYEAVQVMRRLKPRHSTFEIFEMLEQERLTTLTGYDHDEAIRVGGELEAIGCTVDIKRDKNKPRR